VNGAGEVTIFLPKKEKAMPNKKRFYSGLILLVLSIGLLLMNGERLKAFAQATDDAKAFKYLKGKMTDPKTGLPKTLDPSLIKGADREGYQVAKEIPEILAKLPCFCGCEAVGHENLLDCFVDEHAVG
jgi:hypothetical protein